MVKMQEKEFLELVNAHTKDGVIKIYFYVHYSPTAGGYVISAESESMNSSVHLSSARKELRTFATIDSAAKFLKSIGVSGFQCFRIKSGKIEE